MPRNGSSVYSYPPGSRGQPNTTISSSKYNTLIDDVAQTFNTLQPVVLGGTGSNTADGAAKELGLISAKDMAGVNTVGGTANAVTITTERVYTALTTSLFLRFVAESDIVAGGMTINLDGIGAKPVKKVVAAGQVDVNAGDIIEGGYYEITYDPTSDNGEDEDGAFILLNSGNGSSSYQVGDFLDTARTLNSDWLRRDGSLYLRADYPELADILPALPDGMSWSNSGAISAGFARKVQKTPTGYMMLVDDNDTATRVYTTDDAAVVWTQVATIAGFRATAFVIQGGVFVAVDGFAKVSRSTDGITWTSPAGVLSFTGITGIVFAFGLFVVTGDNGKIATSPDGVTWTSRTSGVSVFLQNVRFLNGVLVIVGSTGVILTSPDGITWTSRTSGVTALLLDVVYGAGLYVAVGSAGTIITSPNLVTWTTRTSSTSVTLNGVEYSTSGFIVVGDSGTVRISTAGTSWASVITGVSVSLVSVAFDVANQARYFIGARDALYLGVRTLTTQFRTPDDNPTYGWIKAVS